jgi:C-terminal processing protease CtpA/Prc
MTLFGREPHVTRIGLNTQGVFSDVLGRSLPNGWRFRLPNEVYFTVEGKAFDGSGVPPDISVPFFSASDLQAGTDRALESAIDQFPKLSADSKSLRY